MDIVIQDGLGVVGHDRQQVALEDHLAIVEVETAHLQQARLDVEGKSVEAHGADEGNSSGQNVEDVGILRHPQALQLREDVEGTEHLQVQHLHVGQPELVVVKRGNSRNFNLVIYQIYGDILVQQPDNSQVW